MRGFNVYYPQGWDCQGFPTEVRVEKKYGRKPPEEFRKLCVEWTKKFIGKMKGQMNALGFSPDWKYEYRTMSPDYWKKVQLSLVRMFDTGEVYRDSHPVFWCPNCNSALAKTDTEGWVRDTAVNGLSKKDSNQLTLFQIATDDKDENVRYSAIRQLVDENLLIRVILENKFMDTTIIAIQNLANIDLLVSLRLTAPISLQTRIVERLQGLNEEYQMFNKDCRG